MTTATVTITKTKPSLNLRLTAVGPIGTSIDQRIVDSLSCDQKKNHVDYNRTLRVVFRATELYKLCGMLLYSLYWFVVLGCLVIRYNFSFQPITELEIFYSDRI